MARQDIIFCPYHSSGEARLGWDNCFGGGNGECFTLRLGWMRVGEVIFISVENHGT
jgi:hypothetical protein